MNTSNDERFHELVHKVLANEAQPTEQSELRTLIAEDPKLKEEFEQLTVEGAVVRHILPMLEDFQHHRSPTPPPPMARLGKEVARVFEEKGARLEEVHELLESLKRWAGGLRTGEGRTNVFQWVDEFRASLLGRHGEVRAMGAPAHAVFAEEPSCLTREGVRGERNARELQRNAEFERRLGDLAGRIEQAAQMANQCGEELRELVEIFKRERDIREETLQQGA